MGMKTTSVPDGITFAIQDLCFISTRFMGREMEDGDQYSEEYPHGRGELQVYLDRIKRIRAKVDRAEEKIRLHFAAVREIR